MGTILFKIRLTIYTILLLSVSILAVFIGLCCTIVGKRLNTNYYVARTFCRVAGLVMGWKFIVEGEEYLWNSSGEGGGTAGKNGRSAVMVGNHQRCVADPCSLFEDRIQLRLQYRGYPILRPDDAQTRCYYGQEINTAHTGFGLVHASVRNGFYR